MAYKTLTCEHCGEDFEGWHNASYCSKRCGREAKKIEVPCENCGDLFRARRNRADERKYCSKKCSAEDKREVIIKTCAECGEEFELPACREDRREHCSEECQHEAYRDRVTKHCDHCGAEYQVVSARSGSAKYCSKQCKYEGESHKASVKVDCDHCGETFRMQRSEWEYRDRVQDNIHCSKECASEALQDRITKTCGECGEEFDVPPSLGYRVYCSQECFGDSRRLIPADYEHLRDEVYARGEDVYQDIPNMLDEQDGECIYCGADITDDFHLDHKRPISRDGEHTQENVHLTCPHCNHQKHAKTHAEYIDWRRDNGLHVHHLALR